MSEFKVGDRVKLPRSHACEIKVGTVSSVENPTCVVKWDDDSTTIVVNRLLEKVSMSENKFKVGDRVETVPKGAHKGTIVEFFADNQISIKWETGARMTTCLSPEDIRKIETPEVVNPQKSLNDFPVGTKVTQNGRTATIIAQSISNPDCAIIEYERGGTITIEFNRLVKFQQKKHSFQKALENLSLPGKAVSFCGRLGFRFDDAKSYDKIQFIAYLSYEFFKINNTISQDEYVTHILTLNMSNTGTMVYWFKNLEYVE